MPVPRPIPDTHVITRKPPWASQPEWGQTRQALIDPSAISAPPKATTGAATVRLRGAAAVAPSNDIGGATTARS
jgi:hypothetical protein